MPPQMADEIGAAFYDLGDARAVLITGENKGFVQELILPLEERETLVAKVGAIEL